MKESYKNLPLSPMAITLRSISNILDSNKHTNFSVDEIGKHIKDGNILDFLINFDEARELKSIIKSNQYEDFDKYYVIALQSFIDVYGADGSEWGIKNSGICLLLVWTIEIIQMGSGWQPNTDIAGLDRD